jgi:hypothetical protein
MLQVGGGGGEEREEGRGGVPATITTNSAETVPRCPQEPYPAYESRSFKHHLNISIPRCPNFSDMPLIYGTTAL